MAYFVVYQVKEFKLVKEFKSAVSALSFAERKGGVVYLEKEGIKYPDEDKAKDRHLLEQMNGPECKNMEPFALL